MAALRSRGIRKGTEEEGKTMDDGNRNKHTTTIGNLAWALVLAMGISTAKGEHLPAHMSVELLPIQAEPACDESRYDRERDYPMPEGMWRGALKGRILWQQEGHVFEPYTGRTFTNTRLLQNEHVVSVKEAHDSGLCAADGETKRRFVADLDNLTVATPEVNRAKGALDAGEWVPEENRCWYAATVVKVKGKYRLSVDAREKANLERVLSTCRSTAMVYPKAQEEPVPGAVVENALAAYDDNGNGRITCKEARKHGIAPVMRGDPAYEFMRDANNDGQVC